MEAIAHYGAADIFIGVGVGKGEHHAVATDCWGKLLFDRSFPNGEAILRIMICGRKEQA